MDWMQLVASLAGSLAWPVAVVAIILVLKKSITARLPALLKLTLPGGISAEFSEGVQELAAVEVTGRLDITEAPDVVSASGFVGEAQIDAMPLSEVTDIPDAVALKANPTGIVMEAWKSLERTLRDVSNFLQPRVEAINRVSSKMLFRILFLRKFLSAEEVAMLEKTLQLRNMAAHTDESISPAAAAEFARLAGDLETKFRDRMELMR